MSVHVDSELDYCNCVLNGIAQTNLDKLQRGQNVLSRVTAQAPWSVSAIRPPPRSTLAAIRQRNVHGKMVNGSSPDIMERLKASA